MKRKRRKKKVKGGFGRQYGKETNAMVQDANNKAQQRQHIMLSLNDIENKSVDELFKKGLILLGKYPENCFNNTTPTHYLDRNG